MYIIIKINGFYLNLQISAFGKTKASCAKKAFRKHNSVVESTLTEHYS